MRIGRKFLLTRGSGGGNNVVVAPQSRADIAIGITGFAGPAGPGQEEGLVHMALARRGERTVHRTAHFGSKGRGAIRVSSLKAMLQMLEEALT